MKSITKEALLTIGSPVFANKGFLPAKYTCDGTNINPPLTIENIPDGTKSLALIVDDPDAPAGTFDHWIVWNIRPKEMILENTTPGTEGKNSFGKKHYNGPCPPAGNAHTITLKCTH
jgi:Raf kinase inhibitor-like YbhB/YbcL family protein